MFQRNRGSMIGKTDYAPTDVRSHVDPALPEHAEITMIHQTYPGGQFLVGPPIQVGHYWWRAIGSRKISGPDEVVFHPINGLSCLVNRGAGTPVHYKPVTDFIREWAGPLPRPPEG